MLDERDFVSIEKCTVSRVIPLGLLVLVGERRLLVPFHFIHKNHLSYHLTSSLSTWYGATRWKRGSSRSQKIPFGARERAYASLCTDTLPSSARNRTPSMILADSTGDHCPRFGG